MTQWLSFVGFFLAYTPTLKQREATTVLAGRQRHTLFRGGARSGKTFSFVRACIIRALKVQETRHAIVRFRYNAVRASVWQDTFQKVMRDCFDGVGHKPDHQLGFEKFGNGSEIWFGGLDEKERVEKILGMEFSTIFPNECSQIPWPSVEVLRTRLSQKSALKNRMYCDINPTTSAHWTSRLFLQGKTADGKEMLADPENYRELRMNPVDNAANIDPEYLKYLESLPARQRKRFYEGEYGSDVENALWSLESFKRCEKPENLVRVVVAVDPSGCSGQENYRSDEIGIVVVGAGPGPVEKFPVYVLADRSLRAGPEKWGRIAADAYREFKADCILGETNFGGAMVEAVIKTADPSIPFRAVSASRGKVLRAEPVSALYAQDRVWHCGRFDVLEDQLTNFSTAGYLGDRSPDHADAMIHGVTELTTRGGRFDLSEYAALLSGKK